MGKTIALIESLDTKKEEAFFARSVIESNGFETFLIDNSTKELHVPGADITPTHILEYSGISRETFEKYNKPDRIDAMRGALTRILPRLYEEGKFDAVLTVGGGQNANLAAPAMKLLPFGVPKIVASSLACGIRTMEQYVGEKDIFVLPTVADIAGLNPVTKTVIRSACSAAMGMVQYGHCYKTQQGKKVIAATMLGVTTKGTEQALEIIRRGGNYETVAFHANGVGGRCMEALIEEGRIDAVLDMNLHEISCEVLGGYCSGARNRLNKAVEKRIPMVVVPGALDMVDFFIDEQGAFLPADIGRRQKVKHNSTIYHCKVYPEEGERLARLVCERLNRADYPVTLIVPTRGCCETSAPGGPLYNPQVDEVMVQAFRKHAGGQVKLLTVDANICDQSFSRIVAEEFLKLRV